MKQSKKVVLIQPTAAEDAAIARGIEQDPDTMEVTGDMLAEMQPLARRGRPPLEQPKLSMTMRVDADVLAAIKATGAGWQSRVNEVLREAVKRGKLA